jgi:hypothetical protein
MAEMVQRPYECQCKGHEGGSRTFYAAPPDWFAAKGYNTPKNCPACREWIKAQTDDQSVCACGAKIRIPHKLKISHFKRVGPYEPITECGPCSEGNRPPVAIAKKEPQERRRRTQQEKRTRKFADLKAGIPLESRMIITDVAYYEKQTTKNAHTQSMESRAIHLEHHLPGSPNSWIDPGISDQLGLSGPKSPTSFAAGHRLEGLLDNTSEYMASTDSTQARDYELGPGRIVRITFTGDHDGLEKTVLKQIQDGRYEVITTHDNVSVGDVMKQSWYKGE